MYYFQSMPKYNKDALFFAHQDKLKTHCNHNISYLNSLSIRFLIIWALCKQPSLLEKMHVKKCVYVCYMFLIKNVFIWIFLSVLFSKTFMNSSTIGSRAAYNGGVFVCMLLFIPLRIFFRSASCLISRILLQHWARKRRERRAKVEQGQRRNPGISNAHQRWEKEKTHRPEQKVWSLLMFCIGQNQKVMRRP